MGLASNYICEGCGYAATVSGGDDAGMMGTTTTVSCAGCKELHDVLVWSAEKPVGTLPRRFP